MLRRLVKGCALFSSGIRKIWVKATNQGVQFGADVFLDSGVRIRVVDGARLIIGDRTTIARGTTIICKEGMLSIGADGFIGERVTLVARDHIEIGADALISSDVTIRDMAHGTERNGVPFRSQPSITKPIAIEKEHHCAPFREPYHES